MKYASGTTIRSAYEMERDEITGILEKYEMADDDKKAILGSLEEAYYQFNESCTASRALEDVMKDADIKVKDYYPQFMIYMMKERKNFPWKETEKL